MYKISDACKEALNGLRVETKIEGTLKLNNGTEFPLGNKDFSQGELSINNRCVSGNDFEYGAVYCGELIASIQTEADRYLFYNGTISVSVYVKLANGTWECIPMGIYNITEAERTGRKVEIKAYDNMILLGDPIDMEVTDLFGKPYEILSALADMSDIVLTQSAEEIEKIPNGDRYMGISVSDENMTPRDVISELCVLLCAFAVFDRSGRLEIREYGTQSVFTATGRKKTGTKISDYIVRYKGLKARVNGKTLYDTDDTVPGLILDIGDNAFLQRGLDIQKEEIMQTIKKNLLTVDYTPCSTELMTGYPALDLGDLIEVEDQYGASIQTYVMSYNWKYRGRHSVKGVGSNPRMHVKNQTEKAMEDIAGAVNTKDVIVHTYINVSPYTLQDQEKEIISINYAATGSGKLIFIATIPFTMETDGYISFSYYLDSVLIPEDTVRQYVARGEHFVTLSNNKPIEKDSRHTLAVKACTQYYESAARQQAAKIAALEKYASTGKYTAQAIDTTLPVARIATNSIRAALYAQGLAGTEEWDGTINISEYVTPMELPMLPLGGFTIQGSLRDTTGPGGAIAESIAAFDLFSLPIAGFQVQPVPNRIVTNYTFDTDKSQTYLYNRDYVTVDGAYRLRTAYEFAGRQQDIDEGTLQAVTLSMSDFAAIKSIEWSTDEGASPGAWKYLICQGDALYNISDGDLSELPDAELTADSFAAYGNDNPPTAELLQGLSEPQVLCWAPTGDSQMDVTAQMIAIPQPQTILSASIDLTHETIKGIESMTATCDEPLILAVSADHKETWKAWSGTDWITMAEDYSGMSKEALEAVTVDQWEQLCSGADALYIRAVLMSEEQSISQIYISFAN